MNGKEEMYILIGRGLVFGIPVVAIGIAVALSKYGFCLFNC